MKKLFPLVLASLTFVVALFMLMPESTESIVTAAHDLPAGIVLTEQDVVLVEVPASQRPLTAFSNLSDVVGQSLAMPRLAGENITAATLGEVRNLHQELGPDERAIALRVNVASGIAGLIKPGDTVGLTAILTQGQQVTYGKYITGGLRVLWVDPAFSQAQPQPTQPVPDESGNPLMSNSAPAPSAYGMPGANTQGTIVLAVSTRRQILPFDFTDYNAGTESQPIYLIDFLPALSNSSGVSFSLLLEPQEANKPVTSGIQLQEIIRTPGATLTPTPSPTPTPLPTATPWGG